MSMGHGGEEDREDDALQILKRRLAKGEIGLEEYERLRAVLPEESGTAEAVTREVHHR